MSDSTTSGSGNFTEQLAGAPDPASGRGLKSVSGDTFSLVDALGGIRGVIESMAPGAAFVAVFVIVNAVAPSPPDTGLSRAFWWALVASSAIVLVALAVRLLQRTPITQALGGLLGTAIGALWAWRADADAAFFAWGLWLNAGYLVGYLISIAIRWPVIGVMVELARAGFTAESAGSVVKSRATSTEATPELSSEQSAETCSSLRSSTTSLPSVEPASGLYVQAASSSDAGVLEGTGPITDTPPNPFAGFTRWRRDPTLLKRYTIASWIWVAMFALRLVVQVPLFRGDAVGWLATARLVMGVPLWGLVLWLTWAVVRGAHASAEVTPSA